VEPPVDKGVIYDQTVQTAGGYLQCNYHG